MHPPEAPPPPPPPPPYQRPRSRVGMLAAWVTLSLFMGIGIGGACSTCMTAAAGGSEEVVYGGHDRVGIIELVGTITDTTEIVRNIREFARRDDLRAIVVRIDSPGGAVAPSQEIYDAMRAASKQKPVVASMGTVAASGGFWSAMGADYIFASPGTITGSIGVISQLPDLRGIAELIHFRMRTFKSGALKDAGNPFREMTADDEELFNSLIQDIYGQFVSVVAERRKLDVETVKKFADGRVFTGRKALELGVVDELGGLYDAAKKAIALAEARKAEKEGKTETATTGKEPKEDPTLVYPKKPMPGLLRMLAEGTQSAVSKGVAEGVDRAISTERSVELR